MLEVGRYGILRNFHGCLENTTCLRQLQDKILNRGREPKGKLKWELRMVPMPALNFSTSSNATNRHLLTYLLIYSIET